MKIIGITILALIALFTGGCSLFAVLVASADPRPLDVLGFVALPAGVGLMICVFAVLWIRRLTRPGLAQPDSPPSDLSPSERPPSDPPSP
ncbi:MAG: hypothetical protein ABI832_10415 [bacterium]